jgi:Eukaryotic initiation factor 4E
MSSFEEHPLTSSTVMQVEGYGIGIMNEALNKTNAHSDNISNSANANENSPHTLSDTWILWAHLPHDTDWGIKSYTKIFEFYTLEQAVTITEMLPPKLIVNCMLFLMRKGINPIWEDERNRNGGCFSYKIINKDVPGAWKQMSYLLVGETMSDNINIISHINGITISPKKNFCIMKVWVANCLFQDATVIRDVEGVSSHGCLFKRHVPEY